MTTEAETGVRWSHAKECQQTPKLEEATSRFPRVSLEGAQPCQCLDLSPVKVVSDIWPPELGVLKPPILCNFVTAATGNQHLINQVKVQGVYNNIRTELTDLHGE